MFPFKPSGGPDAVGGLFPSDFPAVTCWNRTGTTLSRGDVVQLALTPGIATEIATNDSNSYRPSGSNDTVFNTVVLPVAGSLTVPSSSFITGAVYGVVTSTSVADNGKVDVQFGGLVDAFVISAGEVVPGQPLTVTAAKNFDAEVLSNETLAAFYLAPQDASISTRELKKVWLTNGFGFARAGRSLT